MLWFLFELGIVAPVATASYHSTMSDHLCGLIGVRTTYLS